MNKRDIVGAARKIGIELHEGQRRLPRSLRGLFQHIQNVWEHRYSFSDILERKNSQNCGNSPR